MASAALVRPSALASTRPSDPAEGEKDGEKEGGAEKWKKGDKEEAQSSVADLFSRITSAVLSPSR